uniref:Monocarboxylate transporter 9 n=1 Tax=Schistocephalus solidus TaxID=70667 RepID=A0A0X3NL07_SCHSO
MLGFQKDNFCAFLAIFGSMLIILTFGNFYSVGNMSPYIISYLHEIVDKNIGNNQAVWLSAASLAVQGLCMPFAGMLAMNIGFRTLMISSCFLFSGGILLSALTIKIGYVAFLSTYAIMVGLGIGASYGILLANCASWTREHQGLILGVCACAYGAGAIIMTPIQTTIINPTNIAIINDTAYFTDEALLQRVPFSFLYFGGPIAAMQFIGCFLSRPKPNKGVDVQENLTLQISAAGPHADSDSLEAEGAANTHLTPYEVIRTCDFILLWISLLLTIIPVILITSLYKIIGQLHIRDDQFLMVVGTIAATFNTFGRPVWGRIGDMFSYKIPLITTFLIWSVSYVVLPFLGCIEHAGRYLFGVCVVTMFICFSGVFVLSMCAISEIFGPRHFALAFGLVSTAVTPGSLITAVVISQMDLTHHVVYICLVCAFFTLIGKPKVWIFGIYAMHLTSNYFWDLKRLNLIQ